MPLPQNSRWREQLLPYVALMAALALVYAPVVAKLIRDWRDIPDYSHGFFVVPVVVWLIWLRRRDLAAQPTRPSTAGLVFCTVALALLVVGVLGAELLLTRLSLLLFLVGSIVFLWGWRVLRVLAFPFLLLALTIPIPNVLMTQITLPLQLFASRVAEVLLGVVHVPVVRDGNVLVLTNATLSVAEACSGVRSLTALVALALILARFTDRRPMVRAGIVMSAPIVAILLNSVRVTGTAIATYTYGPAAAEGMLHEAAGSLVFVLSCLLMLGAARAIQTMVPIRRAEAGR